MKNIRNCKECGEALPKGDRVASYAARKLGYCQYHYQMNFPMRPARSRYPLPMPDSTVIEVNLKGAGVFNPDSPWDWYETFFPENER